MKRTVPWITATLATVGAVGVVMGANSDTGSSSTPSATPATQQHHWHRGGEMAGGGLLRAFHQLNLTTEQQQSVHTILTAARSQFASERQSGVQNFAVLANPGDPNYAAAMQSAKERVAARMDERSQVEQQLYNVLTPAQKAQLPQVLASIQSKMAARAAARQS